MPLTQEHRLVLGIVLVSAGAVGGLLSACQEPAGLPPTLEAGEVSFSFIGQYSGSFTADGRCYWSTGYPAADTACSVAMDLGDTIRIRGVYHPRTIKWQHVNVQFPADGSCDELGACGVALDYLNRVGVVERSFRSLEADVTIDEQTADRIRGTFTGLLFDPEGEPEDTIRISDGTFDVPVDG